MLCSARLELKKYLFAGDTYNRPHVHLCLCLPPPHTSREKDHSVVTGGRFFRPHHMVFSEKDLFLHLQCSLHTEAFYKALIFHCALRGLTSESQRQAFPGQSSEASGAQRSSSLSASYSTARLTRLVLEANRSSGPLPIFYLGCSFAWCRVV